MEYRNKKIKAIEVVDNSNNGEVIAHICDTKVVTTNGFEIKIIPHLEEYCDKE